MCVREGERQRERELEGKEGGGREYRIQIEKIGVSGRAGKRIEGRYIEKERDRHTEMERERDRGTETNRERCRVGIYPICEMQSENERGERA